MPNAMPKLGPSIEEETVVKWHKAPGARLGIAPEGVIGTGTGGRIMAEDVERAADNGRTPAENHARAMVIEPKAMRQAVGQRMKTDVERWGKVVKSSGARVE